MDFSLCLSETQGTPEEGTKSGKMDPLTNH